MQVTFYTFSKKKNSTAVPSGGTTVDCKLKDNCSIVTPTLVINEGGYFPYNYAYIPTFGRYYFVTDVVSVRQSIWEVTLKSDVLASFRDIILNTSCYVIRSGNGNKYIMDSLCVGTNNVEYEFLSSANGIEGASGYILKVVDCVSSCGGGGAVSYYYLDQSNLDAVMRSMYTPAIYEEKISDAVVKSLFNPYQYVIGCAYNVAIAASSTAQEISLGFNGTGISGNPTYFGYNYSEEVSLPITGKKNDFRDLEPYTEYILWIPYAGCMHIAPSELNGTNNITVRTFNDYATGIATVVVRNGNGNVIGRMTGSLGADIPLAQIETAGGIGAFLAGAGSIIAGTLTANPALIAAGVPAIGAGMFSQTSNIIGGQGNQAQIAQGTEIALYRKRVVTAYEPGDSPDIIGIPDCTVKTPISCNGFCQTRNFSATMGGTEEEKQEVSTLMDGGVYIV